ncbi:MAG: F0F1 ATP synthase subunit gamma [Cyanophyceae cyanobacterium]
MTLELKRKIDSANDLQSVVKTMKALAAVSIRQYEKAVVSLAEYNRTLELGTQILLKNAPESLIGVKPARTDRLGIVVFGSDQGLCGQFNERLAQLIETLSLPVPWSSKVLTVGVRIRDRLAAAGITSEVCFTVPSSISGITPIVQKIVITLEAWRRERAINHILLFHNYPRSSAAYSPQKQQLFPLNLDRLRELQQQPWSSRSLPTYTMDRDRLASALFRQYFFVALYRACAESLASENASRLASMQIAEKNISDRLTALQAEFNHQRQTTITNELLDIVAGFEALIAQSRQLN